MNLSLEHKIENLFSIFAECPTQASKYEKIIELGQKTEPLPIEYQIEENKIHGCQSTMFLRASLENDTLYFQAASDALISSGLAVLLTSVYNGESPKAILTSQPLYLEKIGIPGILTPNRTHGLYSIYLSMKQKALKFILQYADERVK